jgi:hypothetical protein
MNRPIAILVLALMLAGARASYARCGLFETCGNCLAKE